jgi:hypothetical protein
MFSRKAATLMKATQRSSTKSNGLVRMHTSKVRKDAVLRVSTVTHVAIKLSCVLLTPCRSPSLSCCFLFVCRHRRWAWHNLR